MRAQSSAAILLAAALVATGPAGAQERADELPYRPTGDAVRSPKFVRMLDSVGRALDLPPLREVGLPDGYREVRLWRGFGLGHPFEFVRVVDTPHGARGEAWRWSLPDPAPPGRSPVAPDDWARAWGCRERIRRAGNTVCPVHFREAPSWGRLAARMDSLGVWAVPDSAIRDPDVMILDGVTLVVEARSGSRYRTYSSRQHRVAEALFPMLDRLGGMARPAAPADSADAGHGTRAAAVGFVFGSDGEEVPVCLSADVYEETPPAPELIRRVRGALEDAAGGVSPVRSCAPVDTARNAYRSPGGASAQRIGVSEPTWLGPDHVKVFVSRKFEGRWSRHLCTLYRTELGWAADCTKQDEGGGR